MQNKTTLLLSLIIVLFGCDNQTQPADNSSLGNTATITIASPQEGQTFNKNDTIKFIGTILSKEYIHGYTLNFIRQNSTDTLFTYKDQSHHSTVNINTFWVNTVSQVTNAEAIIVVTLDHDGNTSIKKVGCICKP